MKRVLVPILAASLLGIVPANATAQPAPSAQSDDAAKLTEARAIIEIMYPPAERDATIAARQADMMKQFAPLFPAVFQSDPGLRAILDEFKADAMARQHTVIEKRFPKQLEAIAGAYSRMFSLAELKDIHAFALTPSGRHYLSKASSVLGDPEVVKDGQDGLVEIKAVTDELIPGFKEKTIAYLKAHPDVAKKIAAEDK